MANYYLSIVFGLITSAKILNAADYNFIPQDEHIFSSCSDMPETLGIDSLADLSNVNFDYDGEKIHVEGTVTNVWEVEEADRIVLRGSMYRWKRGVWEPTVINMVVDDFCKEMWRTDREWFVTWGQFVDKDLRKCLNHRGNVYKQKPFDVNMRLTNLQGNNWSGRYKIEVIFEAFDKNDRKRTNTICTNILGDLEKV